MFTLLANIIGVQASGLVGRGESHVTQNKGGLTGKCINGRVSSIALVDQLGACGNGGQHCIVLVLGDNLEVVAVVPNHFWVPLVLLLRIGQSIADCQTGKVQVDRVFSRVLVSIVYTVRNRRNIVLFMVEES